MDHLSPELTEILERAAARNLVDYVSAYRAAYPELEATAMPFAGGTAAFTGDESPLTTIKGAGPDIADDQLELVEAFLRGRGGSCWRRPHGSRRLRSRGSVITATNRVTRRMS